MKIEKVNEHQIRCTLTGADLANRELKISELAYGSEKAKKLFRDMMRQASFEVGFEAEDIPLMIEAIPVNADCIVLIITKVEDPEEIDTRFSKFAPSVSEEEEMSEGFLDSELADDVLDLFHRIKESAQKQASAQAPSAEKSDVKTDRNPAFPRMVVSKRLGDLCTLARNVTGFYREESILYKNPTDQTYVLFLTKGSLSLEDFGRVCNVASEYGKVEKVEAPKEAFIQEHYEELIGAEAVASLAQI